MSPAVLKETGPKILRQLNLVLIYPRLKLKTSEEIEKVLQDFHDAPMAGHPGQQRLLEKLRRHYSWKNMRRDVKRHVGNCEVCKLNKHYVGTVEPYQLTTTPARPFDAVSVDTVGPLPVTSRNNRYILSVQCDFSKYVIYIPTPNKEAKTIASALVNECIRIYGPMRALRSDQGTEFTNEILLEICKLLKVERLVATAYHPQTIGSLERNHRVMNDYFRTTISTIADWDEWLPYYSFAYNSCPNTTHRFTPFERFW